MQTFRRTSLPLLFILLGILACALPGIPQQVDQNSVSTAVAQTLAVIAQMTRDAGSGVVDVKSATPSATLRPEDPTYTPLPPTFTPTLTLSPTAVFTVTPLFPMIHVSVATNCRLGPGKLYRLVGALLVGETVRVYARDPSGDYWYIRNPDRATGFCWVWGEYATVTGITSVLPIYTPPPTPTPTRTATPSPGFDVSYGGIGACAGWWVDVDLENTGSMTFKSVSLTVKDTVTSSVVATVADGFVQKTGCTSSLTRKALLPGRAFTESSPRFSYKPVGHKMRATVTLCSDLGLNGSCVTESIVFTP